MGKKFHNVKLDCRKNEAKDSKNVTALLVISVNAWRPMSDEYQLSPIDCLTLSKDNILFNLPVPVSKNKLQLRFKVEFIAITNTSVSGLLIITLLYVCEACLA